MSPRLFAGASALALLAVAQGAAAQPPPASAPSAASASPPATTTPEVVVTGGRFLDADTSGITNLPLPVEKVPQSISLINNAFTRTADLTNMGEIAQYTPGALFASYSPSYGNQIWLRGFAAEYAMDGLLVGDQVTDPDPVTLERYEIVKGPASVVYGAQSPGGVVNLVSKSAAPDAPSYVEALGGSYGRWRLEGQLAGPLDSSGALRGIVAAAHEQSDSFVDFVRYDRSVIYGGLDYDLAPGLTGYARATYQKTQDTPFNGIPTYADGRLPAVGYDFFIGASDLTNTTEATRADTGLVWKPTGLWSLDLKAIYQHTDHAGGNDYNYGLIDPDGGFPVGGEAFDHWVVDDYTLAGSAIRKLDDVGLQDSSVSASIRYQHYRYDIEEQNLTGGSTNVFDGDRAVAAYFNTLQPTPGGYEQDQRESFLTASLQAVVKVVEPLTLVGGLAYSKPNVDQQVYEGPFQNYDPGSQVNYRGAAIYEPVRGLNLYASYSESYLPNLRIDTLYHVLAPISGKQYEVGAKYLLDRDLLLTAALFQIDEDNVAIFDSMVRGEALYRASDVRHRGMELEGTGQIVPHWQLKAGLALLDPRVTDDPENPVNDGESRPWLPRVNADLFTVYDFRDGISLGGGLRYVGSVKTYDTSSAVPTPDIPSYVLFDTIVAYTFDRWRLQLNLKNMFNEHYYVSSPIFQSLAAGLYPGEPRSVSGSVTRRF